MVVMDVTSATSVLLDHNKWCWSELALSVPYLEGTDVVGTEKLRHVLCLIGVFRSFTFLK